MDVHTMFLSLDKEAQTPLYYQIKQQILHHISTGALGLGDLLPPEAEICEKLQISRPTVRQAIATGEPYKPRVWNRNLCLTPQN